MFSPSIRSDSLGIQRREAAVERNADAIHNMLEWNPPARSPSTVGFFATRDKLEPKSLTRRVVFSGTFWMADEPVAAWRPLTSADCFPVEFKPVSSLAVRAVKAGAELRAAGLPRRGELVDTSGPKSSKPATVYAELALEPLEAHDEEMRAIKKLAGLELHVEVVRFSKPAEGASGLSTGRVLAVSEHYAAQDLGCSHVVIHENRNLSRQVAPGEKLTMAYEDGKATIYDGLVHDINIAADWMPKEQQNFMRMVMLDALSMMKAPQNDDERLRDAMRYALESTANFFGLAETKLRRTEIKLVVNEKASYHKPAGPQTAADPTSRPARRP